VGRHIAVALLCAALTCALAPSAGADDPAHRYPLGVYVTGVQDIDVARRTAGIDMWLWSLSADKRRPLKTIELVNADDYTRNLAATLSRPQGVWSQVKVSGTFRQLWDFSDFPFDRQTVRVVMEEGVFDRSSFLYQVDRHGSGYDHAIEIPGWRITSFDVHPSIQRYETTFGDPLLKAQDSSEYSRVVAELDLRRDGAAMTFFKLTVAMYAAILMTLASFFLHPDTITDLGARMGLLAGALFTAVLNVGQASSAIGESAGLSLLDELHVVAFVLIVMATVIGIVARRRVEAGHDPVRIRHFDHLSFGVCATLAVGANVGLIAAAAAA
jgi:hypothetical protein